MKDAKAPMVSSTGGTSPSNQTFTPGLNPSPIAPRDPANSINLQPGLLTGEADIKKVEK